MGRREAEKIFEDVERLASELEPDDPGSAARLREGARSVTGLTDGYVDFLEAVEDIERRAGAALAPQRRAALRSIRDAAYRAAFRHAPPPRGLEWVDDFVRGKPPRSAVAWLAAYGLFGVLIVFSCWGLFGGRAWFPLAVVVSPLAYLGLAGAILAAPMYASMAAAVYLAGRYRAGRIAALCVALAQAGSGYWAWLAYAQTSFAWEFPDSALRGLLLAAWLAGLAGLVRLGRLRDLDG